VCTICLAVRSIVLIAMDVPACVLENLRRFRGQNSA
jgi:hypothetical protein